MSGEAHHFPERVILDSSWDVHELVEASAGLNDVDVTSFVDEIVETVFSNLADNTQAEIHIREMSVQIAEIVLEQHNEAMASQVGLESQRFALNLLGQLRAAKLYGPDSELDYRFDRVDRCGDIYLRRVSAEEYNQRIAYYHNTIG